jgi:hypothetical protein
MEWRPIKGFEGLYEVSSEGQIKSLEKVTSHWKGGSRILKEKILSSSDDKNGYKIIGLSNGYKSKTYKVHRIVADTFIENKLNKPTVNHINNIKSDNSVNNLEWNTFRENSCHRSLSKNKTSNYSNIHFCKTANKWIAQIQSELKKKMIGAFDSEEIAYNNLVKYKIDYGVE